MLQRTFGRRVVTEPLPTESVVPVLTPESARALEDAATAQMNAIVERVNAHIPGVSVIPWAIIPWSVWEGLNAELLISTDFLPSSPWNNLLLPADARSAEFLSLPEHPRTATPGLHENITPLIDQLRAELHAQVEACKIALSADGWSALERLETRKSERFQKLFALARHVSVMVHGEAVCAHHDELFGIGLSEVTG